MTTIAIEDLRTLCRCVLIKAGLRSQDAEIIIDHYLENELSGKISHGMVRVVEAARALGKYPVPTQDPVIVTDNGSMAVLDARGQIGVVAGRYALDLALGRVKVHGMVFIGVRNFIANSGSMAFYLRRLTEQGCVGLMGCNSVALVAPPGGRQRKIGTNPIGIGIPGADGEALIVDIATSAIAYGKIMVAKEKNEPVPDDVLIDKDGNPSTDPADAYDGAILPLAGYKGFGLGLAVELLAGPLIGARAIKNELYSHDGLFIVALDPQKLGNDAFLDQVKAALDNLRQTPRRSGVSEITLPGDRSAATLAQTTAQGSVNIAGKTLADLQALARPEAA